MGLTISNVSTAYKVLDGFFKHKGKEIAEVFCELYETVYKHRMVSCENGADTMSSAVDKMQSVTMDELRAALRS